MGPWAEPAPRLASTLGVRVGDGRPSPLKSTPPGAEPEPLFPITVPRVPVGPSGSLLSPGCSPEELRLFIQKISPFAQALSRVQFFVIPWTVARQAPLSMGFSRQEYWSGLPFSPPGDLPDLGVEPTSPWWLSWKRIRPQCKRPGFDPWVGNIRWSRDRLPTPVFLGFPCDSAGKESTCNARDLGSIPRLGRSPGEGNGYPLQYSGLENSTDCVVHGVGKSRT